MIDNFLSKWHLDRELPVPLSQQIKGQIIYAIIYGEIKPEAQLPSVRELSSLLKVSNMTITNVYRELVNEGLVVSLPRVGYFVATEYAISESNHGRVIQKNLCQIIDNSVRQALLLGHSINEICEVFNKVSSQYLHKTEPRTIVLVGNFMPATISYAVDIEGLADVPKVKVIPVLISDLAECKPSVLAIVQNAELVVTGPHRLPDVRKLLEKYRVHVTAIPFGLHNRTRERLSRIGQDKKIGIVSTYPEFLQAMVDQVMGFGITVKPRLCSWLGHEAHIREILKEVDVLIYASGCEEILDLVPEIVETIEFRHTPEPEYLKRLLAVL